MVQITTEFQNIAIEISMNQFPEFKIVSLILKTQFYH